MLAPNEKPKCPVVCFVTPTFPPENGWGGIGTYVHHLVKGLDDAGRKSVVVCGVGPVGPSDYLVGSVRVLRVLDPSDQLSLPLQVQRVVEELMLAGEIDIVEFPEFGALGLPFQRANRSFPVVVRLHGDSELCYWGNLPARKKLLRRVVRKLLPLHAWADERRSAEIAHWVTAPSQWAIDSCVGRHWALANKAVTPNPFLGWAREKGATHKTNDRPQILFLGRLDYRKGAELIPAVLNELFREVDGLRVEIIGQTSERHLGDGDSYDQWILKQIPAEHRDNVVLSGGVEYHDLPSRLAKHTVAVFMSTWETFGYTHVECMHEGIACVIASGGGARELGKHLEHVVYAHRAPKAIAKAVVDLLQDHKLRQSIGCGAARIVRDQFGAAAVDDNAKVYDEIMREAAMPGCRRMADL